MLLRTLLFTVAMLALLPLASLAQDPCIRYPQGSTVQDEDAGVMAIIRVTPAARPPASSAKKGRSERVAKSLAVAKRGD